MATMKDVALKAGVSIGTVSNVMSGARPVRPETAARTRAAMAELNYLPNGIARSLRGRRTRTVGLSVPDNANPFYAETARAIEAACADAGFGLMLSNTARSTELERASIALFLEKRVDGIIVATSSSAEVIAGARTANVPLIVLDHDHPGLGADAVLVDHRRGGELAARHMLDLGHREIACITGLPIHADASRVQGFRAVLRDAGLDLPDTLIEASLSRAEDGYRATMALLARHPSITAIFASNDLTALGAVRAGYDYGRPVPDALSVIGYDDISLAGVVLPRLTTIRQPLAEIGRRAIDVLQRRIEHPTDKAERWVLPVELIVRESTTAHNAERRWARESAGVDGPVGSAG